MMKQKKFLLACLCAGLALSGCASTEKPKKEDKVEEKKEEKKEAKKADSKKEKPAYEVISDRVDDFEETPVQYYGKGYVVKVNGRYGFIDENGQYIYEPTYASTYVMPSRDQVPTMYLKNDAGTGLSLKDGSEQELGVGAIYRGEYCFDSSYNIYLDMNGNQTDEIPEKSVMAYKKEKEEPLTEGQDYYIYSQPVGQFFGPYSIEEPAMYSIKATYVDPDLGFFGNGCDMNLSRLFYEKVEGGYKIHNSETGKCLDTIFDKAEPLSDNSFYVEKGKEKGIVNEDCQLVLLGDYENVSEPLNGKAYVKVKGKWQLIQVD